MSNIANIITQILTYSDTVGTTDNPQLRNFDWSRRLSSISIKNPYSRELLIPAGQSSVIFDGLRSNSLDATSVLSIENIEDSLYKLSLDSGTSPNWRTPRPLSGITGCVVTVNNNAVATFDFAGATLTGIQSGDFLRISGEATFEQGPYSFNYMNGGLWKVLSATATKIQAVRPAGEPFSAIAETVASVAAGQVKVYSADGVQVDDKMEISGAFSQASRKIYTVKDVTSDSIYFTSTSPLPEEAAVAYPDPIVNGHSVVVYSSAKTLVYLEADQDISVKFNADATDNVRVSPIVAGSADLVGYLHKFGPTYKVEVKNRSVNTVRVLYFVAE